MTTGKAPAEIRLHVFAVRERIEERLDHGNQHREIFRPAAGHGERHGAELDRRNGTAWKNFPEHLIARAVGALQDPIDLWPGRRPHRQTIAPEIGQHQVVGVPQRLLMVPPRHLDHRRRVGGPEIGERIPNRQPVVELLLAGFDGGEIAAGQERVDRKCHDGHFRRQSKARHRVAHHAEEIGASQQHCRDVCHFKLGRGTSERRRARAAGGVADDHAIDAALLDLGNRGIRADRMLALREGIDRQDFDALEILLQHTLQDRQRAMSLPLLVAEHPDALAVERGQSRRVPLGDFKQP